MSIAPTQAKTTATYRLSGAFYAMAAHWPSGQLFVGGADRAIHIVDLSQPPKSADPERGNKDAGKKDAGKRDSKAPADLIETLTRLNEHKNYVSSLALAGGEKPVLVSASFDRTLAWWDPLARKLVRRQEAHAGWVREVVFLRDGQLLASVGDDMLVKLWDAANGKLVHCMEGHAQRTPQGYATALYCVAASPDGRFLASADRHGEVRIWEVDGGKLARSFSCPKLYTYDVVKRSRSLGGIRSLAFSADGTQLAVGGIGPVTNVDGFVGPARIEVWDWQRPQCLVVAQAEKHKAVVNHAAFHPSGEWLLGAGGGDSGGFLGSARLKARADRPANGESGESASADTTSDAAVDVDESAPKPAAPRTVALVNARPKTHLQRMCIHPAGKRLYTVGFERLDVWDLETAK